MPVLALALSDIAVQIFKTSWRIPTGTKITVEIGFDKDLWGSIDTAIGTTKTDKYGKSGMVEFGIARDSVEHFLHEFGEADTMWLNFPNGSEGTWTARMVGSRKASGAFAYRIATLMANKPSQPFGAAPATQPFGRMIPGDGRKKPGEESF